MFRLFPLSEPQTGSSKTPKVRISEGYFYSRDWERPRVVKKPSQLKLQVPEEDLARNRPSHPVKESFSPGFFYDPQWEFELEQAKAKQGCCQFLKSKLF